MYYYLLNEYINYLFVFIFKRSIYSFINNWHDWETSFEEIYILKAIQTYYYY